jgi:hypothetical protein
MSMVILYIRPEEGPQSEVRASREASEDVMKVEVFRGGEAIIKLLAWFRNGMWTLMDDGALVKNAPTERVAAVLQEHMAERGVRVPRDELVASLSPLSMDDAAVFLEVMES